MFRIEKRDLGFLLIFAGRINKSEMEEWVNESQQALSKTQEPFSVIMDMRTLKPLTPDVHELFTEGHGLYRDKGMKRAAIIVDDHVTMYQLRSSGQVADVSASHRYIDASREWNWAGRALAWVSDGVDPDEMY